VEYTPHDGDANCNACSALVQAISLKMASVFLKETICQKSCYKVKIYTDHRRKTDFSERYLKIYTHFYIRNSSIRKLKF